MPKGMLLIMTMRQQAHTGNVLGRLGAIVSPLLTQNFPNLFVHRTYFPLVTPANLIRKHYSTEYTSRNTEVRGFIRIFMKFNRPMLFLFYQCIFLISAYLERV